MLPLGKKNKPEKLMMSIKNFNGRVVYKQRQPGGIWKMVLNPGNFKQKHSDIAFKCYLCLNNTFGEINSQRTQQLATQMMHFAEEAKYWIPIFIIRTSKCGLSSESLVPSHLEATNLSKYGPRWDGL